MKIRIKGFGVIRKYIVDQGKKLDVPENTTILDIIRKLNINPQLVAVVTVNGELTVKSRIPKDGDEIFLINTASGG
jgi:sulfur carrier protein ThiS